MDDLDDWHDGVEDIVHSRLHHLFRVGPLRHETSHQRMRQDETKVENNCINMAAIIISTVDNGCSFKIMIYDHH